jgi:hypothetical protein
VYYSNAQDMEVYAAFLSKNFEGAGGQGSNALKSFVLPRQFPDNKLNRRRQWENYILAQVSGPGKASPETLQAFLTRPERSIRIRDFAKTEVPVNVVEGGTLEQIFKKGGWDGFWKWYPGSAGLLTFSGIGFNKAGTEAIFTTHLGCGARCDYRNLVFMKKIKGDWTVIIRELLP